MKSSRKKLLGLLVLLLFLVPLGMAVKKVYRDLRQAELNRALIVAVKNNDTVKVVVLLAEGADPNARDIPPDIRPQWRRLWDRLQGKPLQADGDKKTALLVALGIKLNGPFLSEYPPYPPENIPLVKALLDAGAGVNAMDMFGETPLTSAAMGTKRETVRLLLDRGAKIDLPDGMGGATALAWSASGDDPSLVKLLLDRGASVNARNRFGQTPLHEAANGGNETILRLLLAKGANVDVPDAYGSTPLLYAAQHDNPASVKLLLAGGAHVNTRNHNGWTPLTLAHENHDLALVKILKKAGGKK